MNKIYNIEQTSATQNIVNINNHISTNVTKPFTNMRKWQCNISQYFSFSSLSPYQIQVKPTEHYSQFDILFALLKAKTCSRIYIDINLTDQQREEIRCIQQESGTEIVNARMVHMFKQHALVN